MLKQLKLFDFRNHAERTFEFPSAEEGGGIVFFGSNGRGKTNILEALSILIVGKSWRERAAADLIYNPGVQQTPGLGKDSALIEAEVAGDTYRVLIQPHARRFERNGKRISLKQHFGKIPTLLFAPEHLGLFSGRKQDRQRFFDRFLIQIFPQSRENLSRAV